MTVKQLKELLEENTKDAGEEFKRIFHGRGGLFEGWKHLTIDSIDTILNVALFMQDEKEEELLAMLKEFVASSRFTTLVIQRRYLKGAPSEVLMGEVPKNLFALENGMKFKLNLLSNQNSLYFPDMKNGRAFVRENAKDKRVLNLFSYTCAFSVAAKMGGAQSVVNIDMSKGALSVGKANHHLNAIDSKGVSFLPHNILKSFSRIRKDAPYDLIIIDPPTLQRGSFEATKDYEKIIKRLHEMSMEGSMVLACLNAPELDSNFLIRLFGELASEFTFVKRLENVQEFASQEEERSLKNLLFIRSR
ncbi:MAG: class I SAM-dependent methyltransferase [Sulfurimonas sp.]|uniref:class I SAM-dependent methyltransferase n=1 Tax=Sulfurimonas sp. TaxID=2022749 RepID=UPI00260D9A34|nr:class I SAM-dependent methyltransferase [Sulfurimonas sp.]MDD2652280.1 class I SAM-dependent methyltransferase [Sulfurimonas sp.]MDD3451551.1 class I SAM-dependent methyltransferase [Sulfurimonas sp.]